LGKLNLRAKTGTNVLAIKRNEGIIVVPGADAAIEEGDILVVLGSKKARDSLNKLL